MKQHKSQNYNGVITIIVIAQFACTSLWFAGNAVIADIQQSLGIDNSWIGYLTSAVQLGFIKGTLIFAVLTISDRYSPSKVFFISALLGALTNLGTYWAKSPELLLSLRFFTGFCLAGIYPVGMKIATDYRQKGLGKALGYLVGALVLGTAFPHFLKAFASSIPWSYVIFVTSGCAFIGGLAVFLFVPNGPYRKKSQQPDFNLFFNIFKNRPFRLAAFGYFGHMWELYTFWAFVPSILLFYSQSNEISFNSSIYSFFIIAIGGLGCIFGGLVSKQLGSEKVALWALITSGICCLISPFIYDLSFPLFIAVLLIWGFTVVADSPQFSTLVAQSAPKSATGTALTIVNSVGFSITIFSLLLINQLIEHWPTTTLIILVVGPLFGTSSIFSFIKDKN